MKNEKKPKKQDAAASDEPGPIRPPSRSVPKLGVRPPTVEPVLKWMASFADEAPRPAFLVLPGSPNERRAFIAHYTSSQFAAFRPGAIEDLSGPLTLTWRDGLAKNISARIARMRLPAECRAGVPPWFPPEPRVWELLWGLIAIEDFVVDEPLRSMLDQDYYLIHDVYRALWEARFLAKENVNLGPAQDFAKTMVRWLTSLLTPEDEKRLHSIGIDRTISADQRLDVMCFLLTLANHNALLSHVVFFLDGLERATPSNRQVLRELYRFLSAIERWVATGPSPIGVLIGHTAMSEDLYKLSAIDDRLTNKVIEGLAWVRQDKSRGR